jgi:uncharacterized RDD family membrane protein YckC
MSDQRPEPEYAGLITRAVAFTIDAVVINVVAITVAGAVALGFSILSIPHKHKDLIATTAGIAFVIWSIGYFVAFWSSTGQTPGDRVMHIRILRSDLGSLGAVQALRRWAGLIAAALPLLMGFALILVDDRRRGLQDRIGGTIVIRTPQDAVTVPRSPAGSRVGSEPRAAGQ